MYKRQVVGSLKFRLLARLSLDGERVVSEQRVLQPVGERLRDVREAPDAVSYTHLTLPPSDLV
mgnify:CR=1 FL=1